MDAALIKELGNLSLGVLAVIGLVFVIYQQLQVINRLSELVNNNTKSIDQNTAVTQELKGVITTLSQNLNTK
jgi:hypothetical protein